MDNTAHHLPKYTCYYCGEPATSFCDGVSHYLVDGRMMLLINDPDVVQWCDRAVCDKHSKTVGMSTASGGVDTIDYCLKHITMNEVGDKPEFVIKSTTNK